MDEKNQEHLLIGILELQEAKRIQAQLELKGVTIHITKNEEASAKSQRGVPVNIWAMPEDVPLIQDFFHRERVRDLGGRDWDPNLAAAVFDPEKADAQCPACGTKFSTTDKSCPECGLVFMSEEEACASGCGDDGCGS